MSLNMYLGEVQNQTQSMNAVCVTTIQAMEQAIQSIDTFATDTVLQGQTYSSAKIFFVQTFRPLAQGIIYLCEELIRQNDAFPSDFQSQVASTDVIEQEIREQIQEINRMVASIEAISITTVLPGIDAMVIVLVEMRKKLQEKLEHLYEFNYTSSNNYNTALQLVASITAGLAEVQSGKGFSPVSGTFSTQGLNMDWTVSIQEIADERKRQVDNLLKEGSIEEGAVCKKPPEKSTSEKIIDGILAGTGQAVEDTIDGVVALGKWETWENMGYAFTHLNETLPAMWNTLSDSFINDVINGDAESRAKWGSYAFTQIGLGLIGDKGISKVTTLAKGAKFSTGMSSFANKLPLTDRLAFAGASGFGSNQIKIFEVLRKARETFMFSKTGGRSKVKDVQEVIQDYADKVLDKVEIKNEYPDSYTASKVLREELKAAGIEPPPYPNAAHHITAWNDKRAIEAQELLEEFGIHHNSAANGVFLPYKVNDYVTTEVLHVGNHSTEYMKEVTKILKEIKEYGGTQEDVAAALHDIRIRLLEGSLKLNNPK
ncbi:cytoplasmic protein [Bacillus cereus]|uniref:AHH domain-containing protein n=1 Tax=Bacillus cereus TaxID=1396 RepID=UPI000BF6CD19|nr:AHH domain-containing protein [Bacillus cereus]PEQ57073.1 cytoplasmic protein [Bacillus cereus]PFS88120.1 cytoplasmic protein [Bacillus cereus]